MIQTRPAFLGKDEVVEVWYDRRQISQMELIRRASSFAAPHDDGTLRYDPESKYRMRQTALARLPMTELQALRVNARLQGDWQSLLSPRQLELLSFIEKHPQAGWPVAIEQPPRAAWAAAEGVRAKARQAAKQAGSEAIEAAPAAAAKPGQSKPGR